MFCWIFSTSGCGFQVISLLFPITAPNILNKCRYCSSYTCYSRGLSLPPNRTSPQAGQYLKERRSYNPCITNEKLELSLTTSFAKFLKQVRLDDLPTRARRSVTAPGRVQSVKSWWINSSVSVLWNPCISKSITSLQPGSEREVRTWLLQPWVAWVRQNRKKGTTLVLWCWTLCCRMGLQAINCYFSPFSWEFIGTTQMGCTDWESTMLWKWYKREERQELIHSYEHAEMKFRLL